MQRVKTKLPDELASHIRMCATSSGRSESEYRADVICEYLRGAVALAQWKAKKNLMLAFAGLQCKCNTDAAVNLPDDDDYNIAADLEVMAALNGISVSEAIRVILTAKCWGAFHSSSLIPPQFLREGFNRENK